MSIKSSVNKDFMNNWNFTHFSSKFHKKTVNLFLRQHRTKHVINLQIFRHITHNFLTIRQYAFKNSMQSDEKYICVSAAQASCGIAYTLGGIKWINT